MDRKRWTSWLLLQLFVQILLVGNEANSSPANKTIRIGYLKQFDDIAGAINVAIEQAQSDGLLRDYDFRYTKCCSYAAHVRLKHQDGVSK